jgi:hypothetical protein
VIDYKHARIFSTNVLGSYKQSLEPLFKLIELTIHTPEWLAQGHKSKRYVDNERPLTSNEINFLNEMRHKEILLMKGTR